MRSSSSNNSARNGSICKRLNWPKPASSALAQAGQRAAYSGEVWKISAEELGGADAAAVTIRVEVNSEQPQERMIAVEADYPSDPIRHVRKNLEAKFILENEKVQP